MTIGIVDDPTAVPITPIDIARLRISGLYCGLNEFYYNFAHILWRGRLLIVFSGYRKWVRDHFRIKNDLDPIFKDSFWRSYFQRNQIILPILFFLIF